MSLTELVLTSTPAHSPLPLTSLYNPQTGQLVYSFKSPPQPSTTTTTSTKGKEPESSQQHAAQTMSFVQGSNGVGPVLFGLGGKDGRAMLNVWNLTRESTVQRLIPPVRLNSISASPDGNYLAGGTPDGRIFLWEISTGALLATLDAHYRSISCLAWTRDGAALITASEDAGCSVWSIGRILTSTPMNPPTPFATLSDHTLSITALQVGQGSFPNCRVFTASQDGTVKIWDLSTTPASLLSTFQFPAPIQHLSIDPLERYFFACTPTTSISTSTPPVTTNGSKITRINLYTPRDKEDSFSQVTSVGGTGISGELERVEINDTPGITYSLPEPITSLHLSPHSPTLYLSTLSTSLQILSLPSLLPTRIISPPPSSTPFGGLPFITTLLTPSSLGADNSSVQREVCGVLGRSVEGLEERERGGKGGKGVWVRLGATGTGTGGEVDVESLVQPAKGLGGGFEGVNCYEGAAAEGGAEKEKEEMRVRMEGMEKELEGLRKGLGRAKGVNERIWKGVVEGALSK
ncbi:hypothetical protein JCM5353_007091 [Sporobolomyces roseus]